MPCSPPVVLQAISLRAATPARCHPLSAGDPKLNALVEEAVNKTIHFSPAAQKLIADVGLDAALDLTYDATKKYSGSYFFEEILRACRCRRQNLIPFVGGQ